MTYRDVDTRKTCKQFLLWIKEQGLLKGDLTDKMMDEMIDYYVRKQSIQPTTDS